MAKLYAELTSDKGGRVVGKGGNESLKIQIRRNNAIVCIITVSDDEKTVYTSVYKPYTSEKLTF